MISQNQTPFYLFLVFALIIVLHHFFAYFGHYGYDDMQYAEIAANLLRGEFDYDHSFSYRSTIVFFTALSYLLFGINDFASALPSLIISISILFVVYEVLKKYGSLQTIAGLSATVFIHIFLFYSDKLMSDIYVALFLLLAVYCIDRYRFGKKEKVLKYAFLFPLSLLLAFLSKETAVLFLPLPLVLFIIDLYRKRKVKFWVYSFIFGAGILVIYLVLLWIITGDPLRRFEVLAQFNQFQTYAYSYDSQPLMILLKRLFYDLFARFISEGIMVLYILILPFFFTKDFKELFRINNSFSLWAVSSLVLLLSVNFMTISPFSYHPVPTDPRHSLFIIPIAAIAASFVFKDFLYEKRYKYPLFILLFIFSIISFFISRPEFNYLYLPLTLLFLVYTFVATHQKFRVLFVILFVLIISVKPLLFVRYSNTVVNYRLQKQIVFDYFVHSEEKCYVFTDPMQKRIGRYYTGFDDYAKCIFVDYTDIATDELDESFKKYLFLNWHTQHFSNSFHQLPFFAKNINDTYKLVFEKPEQGIFIYEIPRLIIPEEEGNLLLETRNDFEKEFEYWSYNPDAMTSEIYYSGNTSSKLLEFSPTFSIELDSLWHERSGTLFIQADLQVNFYNFPASRLIFSLETDEGNYLWEAKEIRSQVRALRRWNSVHHDILLNAESVKPASNLKIYIWNPENDRGYIDDFGITVYQLNSQ
jgi:4-amino-4-deoxy-L-arabinose transferase-like glycosyltransferase